MNKKEIARDLFAFGSIPFLVIVLVRIFMTGNIQELVHILIASVILFTILLIFKKTDYHLPLIIIIAIFTSIFYQEPIYTIFAIIIVLTTAYCSKKYLKKKISLEIIMGLISSILSYLIVLPLNIPNF